MLLTMTNEKKVWNKTHRGVPLDAVYVGRPTVWGNPYVMGVDGTRREVIAKYAAYLDRRPELKEMAKQELRGKDLMCWCAPLPCHADVLFRIANEEDIEMSWDIRLIGEIDGQEVVLFDQNYTHNCNPMIRHAGLEEWPYNIDGMGGLELATKLSSVIKRMEEEPEVYRAMNPPNGWGSYNSLLPVLRELRDIGKKFPSGRWKMWA